MCSTPYGIRGLAQYHHPRYYLRPCVLNALRHQRFGTSLQPITKKQLMQCSTPYGIRGLAHTVPAVTAPPAVIACSTPYGIRGLAHKNPRGQAGATRWCSTPYGIRGLARKDGFGFLGILSRAQRLTASEVWHWLLHGDQSSTAVCSTPYGIRGLAQNLQTS